MPKLVRVWAGLPVSNSDRLMGGHPSKSCILRTYAGINLTGYHPPGTPGLLHRNVCPAPGLLQNRKCPGAGPIKDDVPAAGHLYELAFKHENC